MSSEEELFEVVNKLLEELSPNEVVCYEQNLIHQLQNHAIPFSTPDVIPENLKVGITSCEFLIAHTGTAMVSSAQAGGRQLFVFPPVHVIIARKAQLVDYLNAAYRGIQKKYGNQLPSQISLITGPSRTADIEKTLVMGAHGPRELHVLIY
jgi:L-lactate dehydrogenase complex protein LldG